METFSSQMILQLVYRKASLKRRIQRLRLIKQAGLRRVAERDSS